MDRIPNLFFEAVSVAGLNMCDELSEAEIFLRVTILGGDVAPTTEDLKCNP